MRAVGEEEADEGMGAALEAAAVVASARGIGEPRQSRAANRPRPAELCQYEMGSRKGLGYPSESDPSDPEVNAGDLTTRVD